MNSTNYLCCCYTAIGYENIITGVTSENMIIQVKRKMKGHAPLKVLLEQQKRE